MTTEGYPRGDHQGDHQEEHQEHQEERQEPQGREALRGLVAPEGQARVHLGLTEGHRPPRVGLEDRLPRVGLEGRLPREDQEARRVQVKNPQGMLTNRQKRATPATVRHRPRGPRLWDRQQRSDRGGSMERRQFQDGPPPQQPHRKSRAGDCRVHQWSRQLSCLSSLLIPHDKLIQSTTPSRPLHSGEDELRT